MPRSCILLHHWEAYHPLQQTVESIEKQLAVHQESPGFRFYTALPYDYLGELGEKITSSAAILGANGMASVEPGCFTELSAPKLLQEVKAQFVLLGKALDRFVLNENPSSINKKVQTALTHQIEPFVCIGETETDAENGTTQEVIKTQLKEYLKDVSESSLSKISLVYDSSTLLKSKIELSPEEVNQAYELCRQLCLELWDESLGKAIPILCYYPDPNRLKPEFIEMTHCSGFYFKHG